MTTPLERLRAVLNIALEREWITEDERCGRGCNCLRGYVQTCSGCKGHGKHEPDCEVDRTLREAEEYLAARDEEDAI